MRDLLLFCVGILATNLALAGPPEVGALLSEFPYTRCKIQNQEEYSPQWWGLSFLYGIEKQYHIDGREPRLSLVCWGGEEGVTIPIHISVDWKMGVSIHAITNISTGMVYKISGLKNRRLNDIFGTYVGGHAGIYAGLISAGGRYFRKHGIGLWAIPKLVDVGFGFAAEKVKLKIELDHQILNSLPVESRQKILNTLQLKIRKNPKFPRPILD